jgi:predicted metal-dependent hydrolase
VKLRSEEIRTHFMGEAAWHYLLRRSASRRSLALRVNDTGDIVVNAPLGLAQKDIDNFIVRHQDWISERLVQAQAQRFDWREGARLPWLGGHLTLHLQAGDGKPVLRREGEQLFCFAPEPALPALITRWYQREARTLLAERLALHAPRAGCPLPPLRLSSARTRWGSLSAQGVVSLNWRLIKAPLEAIDYVICHELAHFRQRNHSPAFWLEVEKLFPEWKRVRGDLRHSGRLYFQF